ncbi:MAG: isocitrate dehydrogenase kinase/phosphatase AceK regulatory subunit, partial [Caldilineaceae bacterium]
MNEPPLDPARWRHRARAAATAILDGFEHYFRDFRAISGRAHGHFERREWRAWQTDAVERLAVRERVIQSVALGLREMLGADLHEVELWRNIKYTFGSISARMPNLELAETFFNSVTRRIMGTIGVNRNLEFVWFGATILPGRDQPDHLRRYLRLTDTADVFRSILIDTAFNVPWASLEEDCRLLAAALEGELTCVWEAPEFESIEMLKTVFYRNKGAYLIGRIRRRNQVLPIVLPLLHANGGLQVDAALFSEEEASKVFSFTRAYFHVDADNPVEIVGFLKSIMPLKPIAELFTAIGWNKHGKTMLYRALY